MSGLEQTTPTDVGDLDTTDYRDIQIMDVDWNITNDNLVARYRFGNFDDVTGEFVPGVIPVRTFVVEDIPEQVDNNGDPIPGTEWLGYTIFFNETFKQGSDTNAERFLEMLTNLLSQRLGLPGAYVKPGRSGKKKI